MNYVSMKQVKKLDEMGSKPCCLDRTTRTIALSVQRRAINLVSTN